ncbi:hypothetical protein ACEWY4_002361 [Coilia grayii]|uniref:C1q domain-containing protein n=1 Tax=Coilia grayii TaxID=363190 RepID=A0ABD1KN43_9TELE
MPISLCVLVTTSSGVTQTNMTQTSAVRHPRTGSPPVRFYAAYPTALDGKSEQSIAYSDVILNEGSAFSSSSGVFTAPVRGIYQFFFSFQSCRGAKPTSGP